MNVFAPRGERCEAGRDFVIGAFFGGNPVAFWDAVAVEPENEAGFDCLFRVGFGAAVGGGGVGGTGGVEHRNQWRKSDGDSRAGGGHSF